MTSQAGRVAKKISPIAGIAAAGLTAGAAGLWAWQSKTPTDVTEPSENGDRKEKNQPEMQRTGPMVAVYLDDASVDKLTQEYPGTNPGRLRKVVVQYNPSDKQRGLYDAHFGGSATVKLTGEASSENRLALMASVSNAGNSVEPQSLSCAVDVTPGDVGGGPLGSAVLIEQMRQAGALTKDSWKGQLPTLSANDRDFPSEEGSYNALDEPLILAGSICRSDWVEGKTGLCRTTTAGGGKRKDGWTPQACTICNTLEASPCRDIYKRFDSLSKKINELQPPEEDETKTDDKSSPKNPSDTSPSGADDERGGEPRTRESGVESGKEARKRGAAGVTGERGGNNAHPSEDVRPSVGKEGDKGTRTHSEEVESEGDVSPEESTGEGLSEAPESEEDRMRREEVEMLENKRAGIMMEMLTCSHFHHVFEDSNADEGLVPDMPGDDEENADSPNDDSSAEGSKAEGS